MLHARAKKMQHLFPALLEKNLGDVDLANMIASIEKVLGLDE